MLFAVLFATAFELWYNAPGWREDRLHRQPGKCHVASVRVLVLNRVLGTMGAQGETA